jgi:hypothetical protein
MRSQAGARKRRLAKPENAGWGQELSLLPTGNSDEASVLMDAAGKHAV